MTGRFSKFTYLGSRDHGSYQSRSPSAILGEYVEGEGNKNQRSHAFGITTAEQHFPPMLSSDRWYTGCPCGLLARLVINTQRRKELSPTKVSGIETVFGAPFAPSPPPRNPPAHPCRCRAGLLRASVTNLCRLLVYSGDPLVCCRPLWLNGHPGLSQY